MVLNPFRAYIHLFHVRADDACIVEHARVPPVRLFTRMGIRTLSPVMMIVFRARQHLHAHQRPSAEALVGQRSDAGGVLTRLHSTRGRSNGSPRSRHPQVFSLETKAIISRKWLNGAGHALQCLRDHGLQLGQKQRVAGINHFTFIQYIRKPVVLYSSSSSMLWAENAGHSCESWSGQQTINSGAKPYCR
jgi:hypothetical protein